MRATVPDAAAIAYVPVSWDLALDLVVDAIKRTKAELGNEGIFAGSYGWASAGRFNHAQSQLKRFMNLAGGFVRHVNTYSSAAAEVIVTRVSWAAACCRPVMTGRP